MDARDHHEYMKARAEGLAARFDRRHGTKRTSVNRDGLQPGWSDGSYLPPIVRRVLSRFAKRAHAEGNPYITNLNGVTVGVLSSGRFVVADGGTQSLPVVRRDGGPPRTTDVREERPRR